MTHVHITLSAEPFETVVAALIEGATRIVAEELKVPSTRVSVACDHAAMHVGGGPGAAAFVDLRSPDGLDANSGARLARRLRALLAEEADTDPERIVLHLMDVSPGDWVRPGAAP